MYLSNSQPNEAVEEEVQDSQLTKDDRDELKFLLEQWWIREIENKMNVPGWIARCRKELAGELATILNSFVVRMCDGGGRKG